MAVLSSEVTARKEAEEALFKANKTLEQRVAERTNELERRNIDLRELA